MGSGELQETLLQKKQQLLKQIRATKRGFNNTLQDQNDNPNGLLANGERLKILDAELKQIDQSLGRLKEGKYGICQECGCKIPPERLAATQSPFCVTCQKARDNTHCPHHRDKKFVPSIIDSTNPHTW